MKTSSDQLIYGVEDLPPWPRTALYALQWFIVFLPTLTVLSTISTEYLGLIGPQRVSFFQRIMVVTGTVMLVQPLWGHRYPLLDGPAAALLLSFLVLAPEGIHVIQGGMLVGGCFLVLLSAAGLMRFVEPLFTPNVIGVILILIAVAFLPYLAPLVIGAQGGRQSGDPLVFGVSMLVMLSIACISHWLRGFPRTLSFFLGVAGGTVIMGILGRLDTRLLQEARWFSVPHPFWVGWPRFSWSATITFVMAYLAVIVNAVGSIYSIAEVVGKEGLSRRVSRGIGITGLGGILAGGLGVFGTVSYGFSPGVVLVTRVGSRHPLVLCGALIVVLVFFQKLLALFSMVPPPVVGAALMAGMASQMGAGISVLAHRPLEGRDYLVVGIPILTGGVVSILPEGFFNQFPESIQALLRNGLVVGIVLVLILEHLLLPKGGSKGSHPPRG